MIIKEKKAPGQKLVKNMSLKSKYWLTTILGIVIISLGLLFFQKVSNANQLNTDETSKFLLKILSIVVVNIGIVIFGKSILFKSELNAKKKAKAKQKRLKKRVRMEEKTKPLVIQKNPQ